MTETIHHNTPCKNCKKYLSEAPTGYRYNGRMCVICEIEPGTTRTVPKHSFHSRKNTKPCEYYAPIHMGYTHRLIIAERILTPHNQPTPTEHSGEQT